MPALPHGIAYEAAPITRRSPVHIDLPPMPSSIPGLESYIQTLRRGMENITPREPEALVGFLNPQGRVTQMTAAQAISTLQNAEIKALQQLRAIKQRQTYVGETQPQDVVMTNTTTSRQIESIDNPLFVADEAESQPQSSISFTPKRTCGDDMRIIPKPATATSHGEVPSTSGR